MRILVIDDHPLFRAGLTHILEGLEDGVEVVEAGDFKSAVDTISSGADFDLLLLDLMMPGMEIPAGITALRQRLPSTPLVVLSAIEDRRTVLRAIDAGAMGYIPKSSSSGIMLQALRLVFSGGIYLPPSLLERSGNGREPAFARPDFDTGDERRVPNLTRRQREVLVLLARGMSNKEIARDLGLAPGTAKIHIAAILKAFNANNRTQAVVAARHYFDEPDGGGTAGGVPT